MCWCSPHISEILLLMTVAAFPESWLSEKSCIRHFLQFSEPFIHVGLNSAWRLWYRIDLCVAPKYHRTVHESFKLLCVWIRQHTHINCNTIHALYLKVLATSQDLSAGTNGSTAVCLELILCNLMVTLHAFLVGFVFSGGFAFSYGLMAMIVFVLQIFPIKF